MGDLAVAPLLCAGLIGHRTLRLAGGPGRVGLYGFGAAAHIVWWGERVLRSVANLTRADGREFLTLAPRVPVRTRLTAYPLADARRALDDLRAGRFDGAVVVTPC